MLNKETGDELFSDGDFRLVDIPEARKVRIAKLEEGFIFLSAIPEYLKPISPSSINTGEIYDQLKAADLNLDLSEESVNLLRQKQFRRKGEGKGKVIEEVMGKKKANELWSWTMAKASGGPRIKSSSTDEPLSGTENRGLMQLTAGLLLLAVDKPKESKIEEFTLTLNQRVAKGYRFAYPRHTSIIDDRFGHLPKPAKTLASVPPGSVYALWEFLRS